MKSILSAFCAMSLQTNLSDRSLLNLATDLVEQYQKFSALSAEEIGTPTDLVAAYERLDVREFSVHVLEDAGRSALSVRDSTPRGRYSI